MVFIILKSDFKTRILLLAVCIASTPITLNISTFVVLLSHIFDIAMALVVPEFAISCNLLPERTLVSVLLCLGREITKGLIKWLILAATVDADNATATQARSICLLRLIFLCG